MLLPYLAYQASNDRGQSPSDQQIANEVKTSANDDTKEIGPYAQQLIAQARKSAAAQDPSQSKEQELGR